MPSRSLLKLADNRQLEYLESGPVDGQVLVFHTGTPNPAADFTAVTKPAVERGLRVISYSRPGYGATTEQPGRIVADAAADVSILLDRLGVTQFRTLGWSGGGPHALACAALLADRCQAAAILAGVAPHDAHGIDFMAGMDQMNIDEFVAAMAGFDELTALLDPLIGHFSNLTAGSIVDGMGDLLPAVDREALTGTFATDMAEAMRHAVSTGIAGWRDDDLAFVQDWGFRPADIAIPVAIWQGRQDRMVPFAHGQWLAAEIPTAQPHLFADEGHLSLIAQIDKILDDLIEL